MKKIIAIAMGILFSFLLTFGNNYHGCALAPNSNHGWVVTIESTLCYHTWNGGVNWEQQNIPTTRDFFDVFFLDSLNGWTANRLAMIWHTTDGGNTWHWQSLGMSKFATRIFFIDSLYGWAAAGEAIVIRTTDGETWQQVIINHLPADTVDFYGVSFVNRMKGWMVAGRYPELDTGGNVVFKQGQGYIVHSEDGGDSWVLQRRDTYYDFFDVKFKDELEGWVVGGNDSTMEACLFHTTDGGVTWHQQSIPTSAKYLRALELIDGTKLWAVGRNGTIIYSSNGGATWSVQTSGVDTTLFDVDFADSLRGLIAGNGVVLYTQNGGRNWQIANLAIMEKTYPPLRLPTLTAYPNPFSKSTVINLASPNGRAELHLAYSKFQIYDVTGKLIIARSGEQTGSSLVWDGKDSKGREVKPGIYFVTVSPHISDGTLYRLTLIKIK